MSHGYFGTVAGLRSLWTVACNFSAANQLQLTAYLANTVSNKPGGRPKGKIVEKTERSSPNTDENQTKSIQTKIKLKSELEHVCVMT